LALKALDERKTVAGNTKSDEILRASITVKRVKTGAHSPNVCDGYRRINSAQNIVMHLGVK
jgi:hypothetical protein